jgi:hypothetical protein
MQIIVFAGFLIHPVVYSTLVTWSVENKSSMRLDQFSRVHQSRQELAVIRASVKNYSIINSIFASPAFTLVNALRGNNLQRIYACMIWGEACDKSLF